MNHARVPARSGPVRPGARRRIGATLLATAAVSAALASSTPTAIATARSAPLLAASGRVVAGSYIVVLKGEPAATGAAAATAYADVLTRTTALGVQVRHRYRNALNGFSAQLTAAQLGEVRSLSGVDYVVPDPVVTPPAVQAVSNLLYGLDRIDQSSGLSGTYSYDTTGAGVTAYLLDTGIRATHQDFGGRVLPGVNVTLDGRAANDTDDCVGDGHGTAVASIVGGTTFGVAKQVSLLPVRVFNCDGTGASNVIAGVDWVTAHHQDRSGPKLAVIEVQTGGLNPAFDAAVRASIASGITYVIPAGNYNMDACAQSPSSVTEGIVVGASDYNDVRADWGSATDQSNYGPCLDLFAPGSSIRVASHYADDWDVSKSGTSFAAPFVAGAVARYLQANPTALVPNVEAAIVGSAGTGVDPRSTTTPQRMLFADPVTPVRPVFAVQHTNPSSNSPTDNIVRADLRVRLVGPGSLDLSKVTLRYWFTRESGTSQYTVTCEAAAKGCSNIVRSVSNLSSPRTGATAYLQVGFTTGAGALATGGNTGQVKIRVQKTDLTGFSEADDFSWRVAATATDAPKVTAYYNGQLVWGTEPF